MLLDQAALTPSSKNLTSVKVTRLVPVSHPASLPLSTCLVFTCNMILALQLDLCQLKVFVKSDLAFSGSFGIVRNVCSYCVNGNNKLWQSLPCYQRNKESDEEYGMFRLSKGNKKQNYH